MGYTTNICVLNITVREQKEGGQKVQKGQEGEIQKVQKGKIRKGQEEKDGRTQEKVSITLGGVDC